MLIYCDTSFLLSLAVELDANHATARKVAAKFKEAVPFTLWCETEVKHGLQRVLADKKLSPSEHDAIVRQLHDDIADGIFIRPSLNEGNVHQKAQELSKKHTPAMPALRTLDILHVASALALGAKGFASFDIRQRELAAAEGLHLHPAKMATVQVP